MLPDFTQAKARARRNLLRAVEQQVPIAAPLLKGIARFRQHEGVSTHLTRVDSSQSSAGYQRSEFTFTLKREDFKRFDLAIVRDKLIELARQMGEAQTKRMLEVVKEAADEVGNVVNAGGELTQEKFLDVFRKVQMDFDPKTLNVIPGFSFVMHPDMAAKVVPRIQAWEKDPAFNASYEAIMATKREDWRDREARRKLVG